MAGTVARAEAHPLGNFTVNHLTRLGVDGGRVSVRYVLDQAEIPTFALDRSLDPNGTPSHAALERWAADHARAIAPDLVVRANETAVALDPVRTTVAQRPGAGGLPTLYLVADYAATLPSDTHAVTLTDRTESGRLGWKDAVLAGEREPTNELRAYPNALLGSPRDRTTVAATLVAGRLVRTDASATTADAAGVAPLNRMNALSDALARGASDPAIVIGALLLAFALGALHALEPGHGKTLLAISLVGARATPGQAIILAGALTVAHTIGVFALGAVLVVAARYIVPETVYPWITVGSGAVVAALGARALAREVRRRAHVRAHGHVHADAHGHAHDHDHDHDHAHGGDHAHDDLAHARAHALPGTAPLSFGAAVVAASTGNIAPCPAALVVLLAALQLHAVAYGMVLIVAFGLGLASVLTGVGFAVVHAGRIIAKHSTFDAISRNASLVSAAAIAIVGAVMLAQGFVAQGFGSSTLVVAALALAAVAGYALSGTASHHDAAHGHA